MNQISCTDFFIFLSPAMKHHCVVMQVELQPAHFYVKYEKELAHVHTYTETHTHTLTHTQTCDKFVEVGDYSELNDYRKELLIPVD